MRVEHPFFFGQCAHQEKFHEHFAHPEHFASATDQVHPNRKATKALAEFIHNHIS